MNQLAKAVSVSCLLVMSASATRMKITLKDNSVINRELSEIKNLSFGATAAVEKNSAKLLKQAIEVHSGNKQLTLHINGKAGSFYSIAVFDIVGRRIFESRSVFSASGIVSQKIPNSANKFCIVRFSTEGKTITRHVMMWN